MSIAAWLLAIPQFIMACIAFYSAVKNHQHAVSIRGSRPKLSSRMCKRSQGAIFLIVSYFPATISWLMEKPAGYVPSIPTVVSYLWDFCVFLCIFEWVRMSQDEMELEEKRRPCRPCPLMEDADGTGN